MGRLSLREFVTCKSSHASQLQMLGKSFDQRVEPETTARIHCRERYEIDVTGKQQTIQCADDFQCDAMESNRPYIASGAETSSDVSLFRVVAGNENPNKK